MSSMVPLRVANAYREVFGTPQGRRVLSDLYYECFAGRTTLVVVRGRADPIRSAFFEGKRSIWNRIQRKLKMDDEAVEAALEKDHQRSLAEEGEP